MNLRSILAATAVTALGSTAMAQDIGDVSAGVGITNFGWSLEGEYKVSPNVTARAMLMGAFSLEDTFEVDEASVDGKADFGGFAVVADYYPLSNPWRVSGGLFLSNTEVTGTVDDQGLIYEGEIAFKNDIAPIITTGFRTEVAPGWSVSGDIGVIVSSLEVSSDDADPVVQADIEELNNDLEDLPVLPFIGFAVSYAY